jgi:hypothetical protein
MRATSFRYRIKIVERADFCVCCAFACARGQKRCFVYLQLVCSRDCTLLAYYSWGHDTALAEIRASVMEVCSTASQQDEARATCEAFLEQA